MKLMHHYILQIILILVGAILFLIEPTKWIGILVIIFAFVYRIIFFRCPHCDSSYFSLRILPDHCPYCGKEVHK